MIHNMKINDSAFKRRKIQIGDIIEFHKISNPEDIIEMKVKI